MDNKTRYEILGTAQDCAHYFASILSPKITGYESTFGEATTLVAKLARYDDARLAFEKCCELSENAGCLDFPDLHGPGFQYRAACTLESLDELVHEATRAFALFSAWMGMLELNPFTAEDLA